MGVIRKKTASRGIEAGTKFHCDVCSIDVTSTVGNYQSRRLTGYIADQHIAGAHIMCPPRLP